MDHVGVGVSGIRPPVAHDANGNGHTAPRVSVVIPALNEAENLPLVFAKLPPDVFEVILVDGHSTDGTIEVALAIRPDVRIVRQPRPGKGCALISGFEASRGDIIVALDADGSTDASEITRFVQALEDGADFVKGSRFLEGGGSADITRLRRLGNKVLRTAVNVLNGTRYTDLCYGYNAFWRRCLPQLELDCDGFEVETVMNIRAARAHLKVTEVPSYEERRVHGQSNLHVVRDGSRILRAILTERLRKSVRTDVAAEMIAEEPATVLNGHALVRDRGAALAIPPVPAARTMVRSSAPPASGFQTRRD